MENVDEFIIKCLNVCCHMSQWAIPFNIRTPLSRVRVFNSYTPEEFQA